MMIDKDFLKNFDQRMKCVGRYSVLCIFPVNVPDKFCVAGDHGKCGAELRGDIGDDFLSKNIDAGGKIIFCEPVHRVLDCKDRLCEIFGVSSGGGAPAGR